MSTSKEIMSIIYGSDHAEAHDDQYQRDKKLYLAISDKLNGSVRDNPAKMAALSVISQYLFKKRNAASINKSSATYSAEQARLLPLRAHKFFPEIQRFIEDLDIKCKPDEFDNAILVKIDIFTQTIYSMRDRKYFELKDFFFRFENCSTPLDLLFRGLFYARAKQNVRKIKIGLITIVIVLVLLFILFKAS